MRYPEGVVTTLGKHLAIGVVGMLFVSALVSPWFPYAWLFLAAILALLLAGGARDLARHLGRKRTG